MLLSRRNVMISTMRALPISIWFWPRNEYDLMISAPNFSFNASTRGSDHGSGTGPFGLGGAAGAAGFGGGGGTAAAGLGGAADSSFGLLISSATSHLFQFKRTKQSQEIRTHRLQS